MAEIMELGRVSSRGQISIPSEIRQAMDLTEGSRVMFVLSDDTVIMKKVNSKTFEEITKPLKERMQKLGIDESSVPDIVHRFRKFK